MQPDLKPSWDEVDSQDFLDHGRFFVPDREEQIEALCALVPEPQGPVHIVELCSGEGLLCGALLDRFPTATVHAYDGSTAMLAAAASRLASHGERFEARPFELADRSWRTFPWPVHAVLSSLAIHHLENREKAELFADLSRALSPGGVLLVADIVLPVHREGRALAAHTWEAAVKRRCLDLVGDLSPLQVFREERWNFYADPEPDPADKPAPLFDQLRWLAEAGFSGVDVFWMKAGHAIFGGVKN
ncbi:MAG TPA: methyltransferase domain-containing protein [Thermoanaerobaculia bacterium]|nr:methyltransferase domain-containing protein [Thermoanaerobaculia bacterium]